MYSDSLYWHSTEDESLLKQRRIQGDPLISLFVITSGTYDVIMLIGQHDRNFFPSNSALKKLLDVHASLSIFHLLSSSLSSNKLEIVVKPDIGMQHTPNVI